MSYKEIKDGKKIARNADQWVLGYELSPLKLIVVSHLTENPKKPGNFVHCSIRESGNEMEVFDTELEFKERLDVLGFVMPAGQKD